MQDQGKFSEDEPWADACGGRPVSSKNTGSATVMTSGNKKNYPDAQSQVPSDCGNNTAATMVTRILNPQKNS